MYRKGWTKGEWRRDCETVYIPIKGRHHVVAAYCGTEANAHLLANAKRLFEALENAYRALLTSPATYEYAFPEIEAALAAADGQPLRDTGEEHE